MSVVVNLRVPYTGSLTGSFNGTLQGSASYAPTAWDDVNNIPVGIVSSSVQINTGSFTGSLVGSASYAQTASNGGNQFFVGGDPIQATNLGYSSTYRAIRIGTATSAHNIALGVDVLTITGSTFGGAGQIFIGSSSIMAPNGAGNDWMGVLRATNNSVYVGGGTSAGELSGTGLVVGTDSVVTTKSVLIVSGGYVAVRGSANPYLSLDDGTGIGYVQVAGGHISLSPRSGKGVSLDGSSVIVNCLTGGQVVLTDGNKNLISSGTTGTGTVVLSVAPTLTGITITDAIEMHDTLYFSSTSGQLFRGATSDGSDTAYLGLTGAGAVSTTRGAYIILGGNENGTYPGTAHIGSATALNIDAPVTQPTVDVSYDLGSPSKRWSNIYTNTITGTSTLTVKGSSAKAIVSASTNPYLQLLDDSANSAYLELTSGNPRLYAGAGKGIILAVSANGASWTLDVGGSLYPRDDITYDIGAPTGNRPRDLFIGRNITALGNITTSGSLSLAGTITHTGGYTVTTASGTANWYRVATYVGDPGRGATRTILSTNGGNWTPTTWIVDSYLDWTAGATLKLEKHGVGSSITDARIVSGTGNRYVEVYIPGDANGTQFQLSQQEILGYHSNITYAAAGALVATGGGTIMAITQFPYQTSGIATTGSGRFDTALYGHKIALTSNGISEVGSNSTAELKLNNVGYLEGTSQYRDLGVYDGKQAVILNIVGSTKAATFSGAVRVNAGVGVNVAPSATAGRIDASNDIVSFSSDKRLKTDVWPIPEPLNKIDQLTPITFRWNARAQHLAGFDIQQRYVGLFAQDVQQVQPEAVKLAPFDNDGHDNSISGDSYLTVQYEKLVPLLVAGIKELRAEITELRNDLRSRGHHGAS